MVVCDFMLLLEVLPFHVVMEVFDVVGWTDAGDGKGVTVFEDWNVFVCIGINFGSPIRNNIVKSGGGEWLV